MFIFDEGDADESFAALAEGPAGGEGDFGVIEEAYGEVERGLAGAGKGSFDRSMFDIVYFWLGCDSGSSRTRDAGWGGRRDLRKSGVFFFFTN